MKQTGRFLQSIFSLFSVVLIVIFVAGSCSLDLGPDSILSHEVYSGTQPKSDCTTKCHNQTIYPDPLKTNGQGSAGKHIVHVQKRGLACEVCHNGYKNNPNHMNKKTDTADSTINLVHFDSTNPTGQWAGDTGAQTGGCASLSCHSALNWYDATPATCGNCHTSASASPNPLLTNGQGTNGKHVAHVETRGLACEKCHLDYKNSNSHLNLVLDTANSSVNMVHFDADNPTAQWAGDTGAQTGGCASLSCHDALDWYSAGSPGCTVCHFAQGAVDNPLLTNGQGSAGKHIVHVQERGLACEACHTGYKDNSNHMNTSIDTADPSVQLVYFDTTNPTAQWKNDTGAQTGGCDSLSCHNSLAWYTTASPGCTDCHLAADSKDNPLNTNGQGNAGKHIVHVQERGLACETCHTGYKSNPNHMNASIDTTDPQAQMVYFDATNPTAQWTGDSGAQTGGCDSLSCHNSLAWYTTASPGCTDCHLAADSKDNPLNTNGQGNAGKHIVHVQERGLACETCHTGYKSNPNHMNASIDTTDPQAQMVFFDATNPGGQWSGDTGAQTGGCASLSCHSALNWYDATPASCADCHTAASGFPNPLLTNGQGTNGKHVAHVETRGLACEKCHLDYKNNSTHLNMVLDTADSSVNMVHFDATNPTAQWAGDTGAQTGGCDSLSCHNGLDWYTTASPSCTDCHLAADSKDNPLNTNGQGNAGKHIVHVQERGLACETCHTGYKSNPNHMNASIDTTDPQAQMVFFDATNPTAQWTGDSGAQTGGCASLSCHSALNWYDATPASCADCHTAASGFPNPLLTNGQGTNGKHVAHVETRSLACEKCHLDYKNNSTHLNLVLDTADSSVNMVHFDATNPTAQWAGDTGAQTGGCDSLSCHKGLDWYSASTSCADCHLTADATDNPLLTNGQGSAGKHIAHVQDRGIACESCHTGYKSNTNHMNTTVDTTDPTVQMVFFDTTNPAGQWSGDTGAQTGSCSSLSCHGTDSLDWYTTAPWTPPECVVCHATAQGTRRQVAGSNGDFAANTGMISGHIKGGSDPTSSQCQVCHDQSTHTAGTVRLKNADTGSALVYDPTDTATLEPFCLSCHDADGATLTGVTADDPFGDGTTLGSPPYSYAKRIDSSWAKSSGHGPNGNHNPADRLSCMGTGEPTSGCHGNNGQINAHGSINQVLAAKPFNYAVSSTYNESDYALCFNCHANYPGVTKEEVFGVKQGGLLDDEYGPSGGQGTGGKNPPYYIPQVKTHFADHNESGDPLGLNDPNFWGAANSNLHWYHTNMQVVYPRGDSSSGYTGIVCVNCHDVHGSNTQFGALYDEMGYSNFTTPEAVYGQMADAALTNIGTYPNGCTFNCHPMQGQTKAWFYPITE